MQALAVLGLVLVLIGAVRGATAMSRWWSRVGLSPSQPVYTVAAVRHGLLSQPRVWIGRTVLLRAVALHERVAYCPEPIAACAGHLPVFADAPRSGSRGRPGTGSDRGTSAAALPLAWGGSDPTRARLRRWPSRTIRQGVK